MTNLILQVKQTEPFARDADAVKTLSALAAGLARSSLRGCLWMELCGARVELSAPAFEHGLAVARAIRADLPGQPTHIFPVHVTARGFREIGTVSIAIRDPAPEGSFPGLSAVLELPQDVFDTGMTALRDLLERCVGAVGRGSVMIGPRSWIRREGAAWATFAPDIDRQQLPARSSVTEVRGGVMIVAHPEDPASESTSAHEAALRVRDVLRAGPPTDLALRSPAPAGNPAGQFPSIPAESPRSLLSASPASPGVTEPPPRVPSFMAAAPRGVRRSATAAMPAAVPSVEPLPFDSKAEGHPLPSNGAQWQSGVTADVDVNAILKGALPLGHLSQPVAPPAPSTSSPQPYAPSPRSIGETVDVDLGAVARAVMSFGPPKHASARTPVAEPGASPPPVPPAALPGAASIAEAPAPMVPALTLQQYASLCVDMQMSPAHAATTLRRYGADEAGKRILDERWARVFHEHPAQRAAFEDAKAQYQAWLSRGGRIA